MQVKDFYVLLKASKIRSNHNQTKIIDIAVLNTSIKDMIKIIPEKDGQLEEVSALIQMSTHLLLLGHKEIADLTVFSLNQYFSSPYITIQTEINNKVILFKSSLHTDTDEVEIEVESSITNKQILGEFESRKQCGEDITLSLDTYMDQHATTNTYKEADYKRYLDLFEGSSIMMINELTKKIKLDDLNF